MPGTNPAEAMRVVAGELPDFPHLPELPDRGPGADLTGRTAALLVDIAGRGHPARLAPGRTARAVTWPGPGPCSPPTWTSLEEVLDGFRGPVKIQLCGPWTLAATLELPRTMNVAIADPGAVADLTASLAEGAAAYAADVAKRRARGPAGRPVRRARAARRGGGHGADGERAVAARRGRGRHAAGQAGARCSRATHAYTVVHCCAATVPFGIIRAAGADGVAFDLSQLRRGDEDGVAESAEAGMGLLAGAVPAVPARRPDAPGLAERRTGQRAEREPAATGCGAEARQTAERVIRLWRRLGLPLATCAEQAVITPACGLAGASPGPGARRAGPVPGGGAHGARADRGEGGEQVSENDEAQDADRTRGPARPSRPAEAQAAARGPQPGDHRGRSPLLRAGLADDLRHRVRHQDARAARARGAVPGPAHARLADPDRARDGLHAVHPGGAPGAAAQPGQRRSPPRTWAAGRTGPRGSAARGPTCAS